MRNDRVTEVASRFEQAILTGELSPGDLLPSERDLSTGLGVSRSVVREAFGRLASLGLVSSRHGSGTRVEAPSAVPLTAGFQRLLQRSEYRLEDLGAVRLPLETAIAELAARNRTPSHLARLQKTQRILGNAKRSLRAHMQADLDFHLTLAEATGNPLFQVMLAPIQELLIESRRRTLGKYGARLAFDHHAKILDAVEAGDFSGAASAMRQHLEVNVQHLADVGDEQTGLTTLLG